MKQIIDAPPAISRKGTGIEIVDAERKWKCSSQI